MTRKTGRLRMAAPIRRMQVYTRKRYVLPFLLPGLIGILIFYVIPFLGGIWYSVTDGSYKNAFVGIQNYINV